MEYKSVKDLYKKLTRDLQAREIKLKRSGYNYIKK